MWLFISKGILAKIRRMRDSAVQSFFFEFCTPIADSSILIHVLCYHVPIIPLHTIHSCNKRVIILPLSTLNCGQTSNIPLILGCTAHSRPSADAMDGADGGAPTSQVAPPPPSSFRFCSDLMLVEWLGSILVQTLTTGCQVSIYLFAQYIYMCAILYLLKYLFHSLFIIYYILLYYIHVIQRGILWTIFSKSTDQETADSFVWVKPNPHTGCFLTVFLPGHMNCWCSYCVWVFIWGEDPR